MKLIDQFKKQRNIVKSLIRKSKKAHFNKIVSEKADTASIWRALSQITNCRSARSKVVPPHLKADNFNEHFLSVAASLISERNHGIQNPSEELFQFCTDRQNDSKPFDIPLLAVHEVGNLIASMANKKSSGTDEISPKILKIALPYIIEPLTYIFNLCIEQNVFPDKLKHAKVIPLPKTRDMTSVKNYRPISILPAISKPLEKHISKHFLNYLDEHKLLHTLQSGFRPKHSCHTALTRLVDTWLANINNKKLSGVVFLDFKKAFDLINHDILLSKLKLYTLNDNSVKMFKSY